MINRFYNLPCSAGKIEIAVEVDGGLIDSAVSHGIDHCIQPTIVQSMKLFCELEALRPCDAPGDLTAVMAQIEQNTFGVKLNLTIAALLEFELTEGSSDYALAENLLRAVAVQFLDVFTRQVVDDINSNAKDALFELTSRLDPLSGADFPTSPVDDDREPGFTDDSDERTDSLESDYVLILDTDDSPLFFGRDGSALSEFFRNFASNGVGSTNGHGTSRVGYRPRD